MTVTNLASEWRRLSRERAQGPRKSLGQNFLVSLDHLEKIAGEIESACRAGIPEGAPPRGFFEIGAGPGNLTRSLLDKGLRVFAAELDRSSFEAWHGEHFGADIEAGRLRIEYADALRLDPEGPGDWLAEGGAPGGEFVLGGNIPYQITSPLIYQSLRWVAAGTPISSVVLLAQDDVVHRAMAHPGDSDYGSLSAKIGALARSRCPLKVPAAAFWPQPKIRSAVIAIEPLAPDERPAGPVLALAWRLIDRAFQQRRKTLAKTLSAGGGCEGLAEIPRDMVEGWLESEGFTAKARPEELTSEKWLKLASFLGENAPANLPASLPETEKPAER